MASKCSRLPTLMPLMCRLPPKIAATYLSAYLERQTPSSYKPAAETH